MKYVIANFWAKIKASFWHGYYESKQQRMNQEIQKANHFRKEPPMSNIIVGGHITANGLIADGISPGRGLWPVSEEMHLGQAMRFLIENDKARIFLADAIATAEDEATKDASWNDILLKAIISLNETPAAKIP